MWVLMDDTTSRRFGILLHPTSLPGRYGIGDLGIEAYWFLDTLAEMKASVWQLLPLGPTAWGNSPYQSPSTFAGNPLLISLDLLIRDGLLPEEEPPKELREAQSRIDYEAVRAYKGAKLREAFQNFQQQGRDQTGSFVSFSASQAWWLQDFSLYTVLKEQQEATPWYEWERELAWRHEEVLDRLRSDLKHELCFIRFTQYIFFQQWQALRKYAADKHIMIIGDIPLFVAHDSADVWAHPHLFRLDANGRPAVVAGVPPDCFSETGQRWGNPVYDWHAMQESGYRWWIDRVRQALKMMDMVRLDHFRGFEAYWAVPVDEPTARHGSWVPGPGDEIFHILRDELGKLPLIAENLGFITPEVERMRQRFHLPGMAILQFAFGRDHACGSSRPHEWTPDTVAYTGTHDNDTVVGWWLTAPPDDPSTPEDLRKERIRARDYLDIDSLPVNWAFLRCLLQSTARMVVAPLQDVLGLGGEARMNFPGRKESNWEWRFTWEMLSPDIKARLRHMLETYDRAPLDISSTTT